MKRFTQTERWDDPWFRRLSPSAKLLWCWMCDKCDQAGVIDPDMDLASFQIGAKVGPSHILELGDRASLLSSGKLLLVKFIGFQYGKLSENCKPHAPVFALLSRHKLFIDDAITKPIEGYPENPEAFQRLVVKEKEKEQDKEKEKDSEPPFTSDAFTTKWKEWEKHRREKRSALTESARKAQFLMLGKMTEVEAIQCLTYSITGGYAGLFPVKPAPQQKSPHANGYGENIPMKKLE